MLTPERTKLIHRYWQAVNYLAVAQIYLQSNPLLKDPLYPDHVHVIFALHGYVRIIHDLVLGRPEPGGFHVRDFMGELLEDMPEIKNWKWI